MRRRVEDEEFNRSLIRGMHLFCVELTVRWRIGIQMLLRRAKCSRNSSQIRNQRVKRDSSYALQRWESPEGQQRNQIPVENSVQ
jgi:hypothetical protein